MKRHQPMETENFSQSIELTIEQHTKIGWHNLLEGFPAKMGTATGGTSGKNRKQVKSMMESSSGKEDRVSHMANVGSQKFSEQ